MDALIQTLQAKQGLDRKQIEEAAQFLLDENASQETKIAFLKALTEKGETPAEIAGFVECFLKYSLDPGTDAITFDGPTIDVCGTGGDKLDLFNVSTTSMFVIAAGGATVVKHGNRGITSKSGGADVLEALGINLNIEPAVLQQCLKEAGVGFIFAQKYHPAFKAVGPVRAELAKQGIRTIFNLIGPLLNPARPECQLVGVCDPKIGAMYPEILQSLGRKSAWIVNGETADGRAVDEMSLMGKTTVNRIGEDSSTLMVHPEEVGLTTCSEEALKGGEAEKNAKILTDILSSEEQGSKREMVLLNAGAGLACAGLVANLAEGVTRAAELIDSGEALARLRKLQEIAK